MVTALSGSLAWWDAQIYHCPWCGQLRLPTPLMRVEHTCGGEPCEAVGPLGQACRRRIRHPGDVHDDGEGHTWATDRRTL